MCFFHVFTFSSFFAFPISNILLFCCLFCNMFVYGYCSRHDQHEYSSRAFLHVEHHIFFLDFAINRCKPANIKCCCTGGSFIAVFFLLANRNILFQLLLCSTKFFPPFSAAKTQALAKQVTRFFPSSEAQSGLAWCRVAQLGARWRRIR